MTVDLLYEAADDAEQVVIAWLKPLRRSGTARQTGDPLPFTLVTHITGTEDGDIGTAEAVMSVHTLCARSQGWSAAKDEAKLTHRRMLELARYRDTITLNDGTLTEVDYVSIFQSPIWVPYEDT